MKLVSLFSGAGGLDYGFKLAGFDTIWANEWDKKIHDTYRANFPETNLSTCDIRETNIDDIPDSNGIIGGAPCQSWSGAGSQKGFKDPRGQLFLTMINIIEKKQPDFFVAENVEGLLFKKNEIALRMFLKEFERIGYRVTYKLLDAHDFCVPQNRKRVMFVGIHKRFNTEFVFPGYCTPRLSLKDVIYDLQDNAVEEGNPVVYPNHEYHVGGFSSRFMSRNRVRCWNEPSFTIQASGRHAPIHPSAGKMVKVSRDEFKFPEGTTPRRLSVREVARIQTFPDCFIFKYESINDGYKMVGNAVPVNLAYHIATSIKDLLYAGHTTPTV